MITKVRQRSIVQIKATQYVSVPKGWLLGVEKGESMIMWLDPEEPNVIKMRPATEPERWAAHEGHAMLAAEVAGFGDRWHDWEQAKFLVENPAERASWGLPEPPVCGHPICMCHWIAGGGNECKEP